MAKIISLKCPECGATLDVEEGKKFYFCNYCGSKILIDDGNTNNTNRIVDEARIREAEIARELRLKEMELDNKKRRNTVIVTILKIIVTIPLLLAIICMITVLSMMFSNNGMSGNESMIALLGGTIIIGIIILWFMWFRRK